MLSPISYDTDVGCLVHFIGTVARPLPALPPSRGRSAPRCKTCKARPNPSTPALVRYELAPLGREQLAVRAAAMSCFRPPLVNAKNRRRRDWTFARFILGSFR